MDEFLLAQDGTYLLQESGGKLVLENILWPSPFDSCSISEFVALNVVDRPGLYETITLSEFVDLRLVSYISVFDQPSLSDVVSATRNARKPLSAAMNEERPRGVL